MTGRLRDTLALWGLEDARSVFVAGRENQVFRVSASGADYALRLRRPGYRTEAEIVSELLWLEEMTKAGLSVPRPVQSRHGRFLEQAEAGFADLAGWLPGRPLGKSREPLALEDAPGAFRALGQQIARLHRACDAWQTPAGFHRCHWDLDGLLGDEPVWGRFWENPTLGPDTRHLFQTFRAAAQDRLRRTGLLDYGLIHADLVRENVLLDGPSVRMIDFDDGGYGYRVFDLATVLLKSRAEPQYPALRAALIAGYHQMRPLDLALLDMFLALRALTYVGWIMPRMAENGGLARNRRFVEDARTLCRAFLEP